MHGNSAPRKKKGSGKTRSPGRGTFFWPPKNPKGLSAGGAGPKGDVTGIATENPPSQGAQGPSQMHKKGEKKSTKGSHGHSVPLLKKGVKGCRQRGKNSGNVPVRPFFDGPEEKAKKRK